MEQPQAQAPAAATACRVLAGSQDRQCAAMALEMIIYVESVYAAS